MEWHTIETKSIRNYRSKPDSVTHDRVEVVLDMPSDTYRDFRKQIEAPHARTGRRADDPAKTTTPDDQ